MARESLKQFKEEVQTETQGSVNTAVLLVGDTKLIQSSYIKNNFSGCFYNCVFDVSSRVLLRELQWIRNPQIKLFFSGCLTLLGFIRRSNTFYGICW